MSHRRVTIAHISDPHFGTTTPQKIDALVKALHELKPELVAFSGDITQRARDSQFVDAKEFCKQLLPLQTIAVPGNHDIPLYNLPARVFKPYQGYESIFGFSKSSHWTLDGVELIGVNTTNPKRHVQGEMYSDGQVALTQFSSESTVRIAMFHHPMDCPKPHDEKNLLISRAETAQLLEKSEVDLVLSGHIHDHLARLSSHRYHSQRPFIISVAGTCLSSRTRTDIPNSFNVIEIDQENKNASVSIDRYDLIEGRQYSRVLRTSFFRDESKIWRPI